jgi:riboflavin transporter FmnP
MPRSTFMTAISAPTSDSMLRFALRLDATLTGLLGVALAAAAGPLSSWTGFTPTQEYIAGAALVLYGVVVFRLAGAPSVRQAGVGVVIANLVCTVAAVALVVSAALPLTALGIAALLGSAVYTGAFAVLQYLGVRRMA